MLPAGPQPLILMAAAAIIRLAAVGIVAAASAAPGFHSHGESTGGRSEPASESSAAGGALGPR